MMQKMWRCYPLLLLLPLAAGFLPRYRTYVGLTNPRLASTGNDSTVSGMSVGLRFAEQVVAVSQRLEERYDSSKDKLVEAIGLLRSDLRSDIGKFETKIETKIDRLETDIGTLRLFVVALGIAVLLSSSKTSDIILGILSNLKR